MTLKTDLGAEPRGCLGVGDGMGSLAKYKYCVLG